MTDPTPTQQPANGDRTSAPTPVTVGEAAARLGLSTEAVRMRLKRGTLPGAKVDGAWRVLLPPDPTATEQAAQRDPTSDPTRSNTDPTATQQPANAADMLITALQSEVAYLRDQLDQRSRELAAERERFDVLHREALGKLDAPPALNDGEAEHRVRLSPDPPAGAAPPPLRLHPAPTRLTAVAPSEERGQASPQPAPFWLKVLAMLSMLSFSDLGGRPWTVRNLVNLLALFATWVAVTYLGTAITSAGPFVSWANLGKAATIATLAGLPLAVLAIILAVRFRPHRL